jgi:uncharacterized protein DUF397
MSGPRISSFCSGGDCVEVELTATHMIRIRSTANRTLAADFTPHEWTAFLAGAERGEFALAQLRDDQQRLQRRSPG